MTEEKKYLIDKNPKLVPLRIGKKEIESLKRMEYFRPLRRGRVLQYRHVLEKGETFAGLVVINRIKDARCTGGWRMVVIDGNHRLSAITEYIEEHPDAKIELRCELWENLSREEEKELFMRHSNVLPISQADKFHIRQEDCLLWRLVREDKNFPCKVGIQTPKESGVRISAIILGYTSRACSAWGNMNKKWSEASFQITENDYPLIKQWMQDMITIFGRPTGGNHWFGQVPLAALAKVYFSNTDRIGRTELIKRLQKKVFANGALYNDMAHYKAGGNPKPALSRILECANSGYSNIDNMLIGPEDTRYTKEIEFPNIAEKKQTKEPYQRYERAKHEGQIVGHYQKYTIRKNVRDDILEAAQLKDTINIADVRAIIRKYIPTVSTRTLKSKGETYTNHLIKNGMLERVESGIYTIRGKTKISTAYEVPTAEPALKDPGPPIDGYLHASNRPYTNVVRDFIHEHNSGDIVTKKDVEAHVRKYWQSLSPAAASMKASTLIHYLLDKTTGLKIKEKGRGGALATYIIHRVNLDTSPPPSTEQLRAAAEEQRRLTGDVIG